jgi:hypothetical protein
VEIGAETPRRSNVIGVIWTIRSAKIDEKKLDRT